jgi:hypothetical protein
MHLGKGSGDEASAPILAFVASIAVISGPKTPLFLHHAFHGAPHGSGVFATAISQRISFDEANGDDFTELIVGFVASNAFISVPKTLLFLHHAFHGALHRLPKRNAAQTRSASVGIQERRAFSQILGVRTSRII